MSDIIYPSLSGLINLEQIPGNPEIAENIVDAVFKNLYYRNYRSFTSHDNVFSGASLDIVTAKPLRLSVPGAEISIILNPSYAGKRNGNRFIL